MYTHDLETEIDIAEVALTYNQIRECYDSLANRALANLTELEALKEAICSFLPPKVIELIIDEKTRLCKEHINRYKTPDNDAILEAHGYSSNNNIVVLDEQRAIEYRKKGCMIINLDKNHRCTPVSNSDVISELIKDGGLIITTQYYIDCMYYNELDENILMKKNDSCSEYTGNCDKDECNREQQKNQTQNQDTDNKNQSKEPCIS